MFFKLFGSGRKVKPTANPPPPLEPPDGSSVLKIVHAGGTVESYYMAVPAKNILEKYPCSVLAKPDVFRRPWEAVVRPEEILVPGQKFFVVPRQTLKKLRRRIGKPMSENSMNSFVSGEQRNDFSGNSFSREINTSVTSIVKWKGNRGKTKANGRNSDRRVRFFGVDSDSSSVSVEKRAGFRVGGTNRSVRHLVTWQPQLTAVRELNGSESD